MSDTKRLLMLCLTLLPLAGPWCPRSAATAPVFGIAVPDNELSGSGIAAELDDYLALGAGWVRTDFRWSVIQPTADGPYN